MVENGTFHYKLWLSKQFPWIADIGMYFGNMVCKNLVKVFTKPVEFKNTAIIENNTNKFLLITYYNSNSIDFHSEYVTYYSYHIIGAADIIYETKSQKNEKEKVYEYHKNKDVKVIIW